ncbi:DUF5667 domain-containing protein [Cryptosporangium arvum]|uniref:DUF5667 domain-containing protein n=1 Tax=Cryptosporangium arvum TaxID=80871 RepID=UPI0006862C32|nr:DUF5667 domain-containing protein [Cryptosporangium arvum]
MGAHRAAEDVTDLVRLAERLSSAGSQVRPDEEFRDRLRQRLIAVASVHGINAEPGFRPPPPVDAEPALLHPFPGARRRVPRRVTVISGTLAGLVALSGVGFASSAANPGDALYGVKRSRETAQLTLARSAVARGQLHLEFARNRLAEAAAATRDQRQLDLLLNDMDSDTRLGMKDLGTAAATQHHPAPLDLVDDFARAQHRELSALAGTAGTPPLALQRIRTSLALVDQVGKRSTDLRGVLRCAEPYPGDALGPVARECPDPPAEETTTPSDEPTTPWPTRPRSDSSKRTSEAPTAATPTGSAAGTTAGSPSSTVRRPSDSDEDFDPTSAGQRMVPQSGTTVPTPMSGSPITPLVGSADDTFGSVVVSPFVSEATD